MKKIGIIGAGPSGILAALFLDKKQFDYEILEAASHVGGLSSTIVEDGYTFDYGPHIMFSKNKEILDFMVKSLNNNVHTNKRNNKVFFKDRIVKYPFENDLKSLPIEDNFECLMGFIDNPYQKKFAKPKNLKQWLLKNFGKGISEKYLIPYNEKVWNVPVEKLSMYWAERIPNPPREDIVKSSIGFETEGYLHQLYYQYPKKGGYQSIIEAWAKKVDKPLFNFKVARINKLPDGKIEVIAEDGQKKVYDEIISTIPIHDLVKVSQFNIPDKIKTAVSKLIINPMYLVNFGVKSIDRNLYLAMYFPDKDFLVNRLSYPSTFSPNNVPVGHHSLQAEITCRPNSQTWKMSDKEILKHVKIGLQSRNLLPTDDKIAYEKVVRVNHAYVVYDVGFEKNAEIARDWFPEQGVHLLGRFSHFEYINVDMVVDSAQKIISNINGRKINCLEYL